MWRISGGGGGGGGGGGVGGGGVGGGGVGGWKFMYNVYHGMVPSLFQGFFVNNYDTREQNARISNHLHVPQVHSNISNWIIRYQGVIIWNKISKADINSGVPELSFKILIKMEIQ